MPTAAVAIPTGGPAAPGPLPRKYRVQAAGLAAIMKEPERFTGRKVGLVLSGGNIDPRMLASIVVRGLEFEEKIISLRMKITDQPGVLGSIATLLGSAGANILDVSHGCGPCPCNSQENS